jgi:branched-chain amino acid transport system permease protein
MPDTDLIANVVLTGLLTGMIYGLMALGLSVVFGVVRIVNFAHGELMTAAMYCVVLLCSAFPAWQLDPLYLMLPLAAVFFVLGYALQRGVINRFIQRPEHSQLLLMLAIATILVNGLLMGFGPDAQSVQTDYQLDSFELGPLLIDKPRVYAAVAAALTALALLAYFRFTTTGKAIRACADNHMGALVTGLPIKHLYALTFGLGAACVAVAGCAQLLLIDVTPSAGPAYTLLAFVIVIVGGLGSMAGALLGGVLIGVSEALAGLFVAPSAKSMFSFALLIVVLIVRPTGLLGARP